MFEVPVSSEENVEAVCRQPQQLAVFCAAPADTGDGSYLVTREQCGERPRQGLSYHLHLFRVVNPDTGAAVQIGIPDEDAFAGDEPIMPGWEVAIAPYFSGPGAASRYEYDLGDGWEHELTLEAIPPRQAGQKHPRCVDGARACPPEDCGGAGGYEDLLTVLRTPTHPEHESMLQWLGGRFDPEKFDAKLVKFDDPARRYELAFGTSRRRSNRGRGRASS